MSDKSSMAQALDLNILRYKIVVSIPMTQEIFIPRKSDIYSVQDYFIKKRDEAKDSNIAKDFDRARALALFASTCGATLDETYYDMFIKKISFTFTFLSMNSLNEFSQNVKVAVAGAIGIPI